MGATHTARNSVLQSETHSQIESHRQILCHAACDVHFPSIFLLPIGTLPQLVSSPPAYQLIPNCLLTDCPRPPHLFHICTGVYSADLRKHYDLKDPYILVQFTDSCCRL